MNLLLQAVLFLARHETSAGGPGQVLENKASSIFTPFDERSLEQFFREHEGKGDTTEEGKYVFLPMTPKPRLLPILSLAYSFGQEEVVRLQLVLFPEKDVETEPRAFGYRYESPEGPGRHHFWHAQPLLEVRLHDENTIPLPGLTDGWRPPDAPAFPLDARCGPDLLFCLMASIYGFPEASKMQSDGFDGRLSSQVRRMRPPAP